MASLTKLENSGYDPDLLELILEEDVQDKTVLQDGERMAHIKTVVTENGYTTQEVVWNEADDMFELVVTAKDNNSFTQPITIGRNLVYSSDFQKCLILSRKLKELDDPPFKVYNAERDDPPVVLEDKRKLLNHLMEGGKKGLNIQRYKGLGEMNPEQLWMTTMHPDKRNLLKVTVQDAVDSDEIFTILMGDEVEPRREFIQSNALEVSMLDI